MGTPTESHVFHTLLIDSQQRRMQGERKARPPRGSIGRGRGRFHLVCHAVIHLGEEGICELRNEIVAFVHCTPGLGQLAGIVVERLGFSQPVLLIDHNLGGGVAQASTHKFADYLQLFNRSIEECTTSFSIHLTPEYINMLGSTARQSIAIETKRYEYAVTIP